MSDSPASVFTSALHSAGFPTPLASALPLVPEASTRRYYRLTLTDGSTLVGVLEEATTAQINMPSTAAVQEFLKQGGINVPEILFTDTGAGVMLQQDLGDLSLNQALRENPAATERLYKEAIDHMLRWQKLPDDGKCPAFRLSFDVEKLMFEFEFFIEHTLLGYYKAEILEADLSRLRADFLEVAETLAAPENKVFTHRDYHSRNIMLIGASTTLSHLTPVQYIIDFQDARLGLVQYDLSSLLCDAYFPIQPALRTDLLDYAFEAGKPVHRQSREGFLRFFELSAFQRIVKAMGTFGRQAALGRKDFEAYLDPAWVMLGKVTRENPELRRMHDFFLAVSL